MLVVDDWLVVLVVDDWLVMLFMLVVDDDRREMLVG